MKIQSPGLQGTYEGACIVCLQPTDTGLAFDGEAEFAVACLSKLGVPMEQSAVAIQLATGCEPGMVPEGRFRLVVRVCRDCVSASEVPFPVPALILDKAPIPCLTQP